MPLALQPVGQDGSIGSEAMYLPLVVTVLRSTRLADVQVAGAVPGLHISAALVPMALGTLPLLSSEYWYTAFRMVVTSACRWALRVSPRFLPGLMAMITIPARMA